jgi:hypothetical protein
MKPLVPRIAATAAAIGGGACLALAQSPSLLLSSINQTPTAGSTIESHLGYLATDFQTGSTLYYATRLTAWLENRDSIAHNVVPQIWSNIGGSPGALLYTFANPFSLAAHAPSTTYQTTDAGYALQPNTIYWIAFHPLEDGTSNLVGSSVGIGQVVESTFDGGSLYTPILATTTRDSSNGGATWVPHLDTTNLRVAIEGVTQVPEPSTYAAALFMGGLIARGAWSARRKL